MSSSNNTNAPATDEVVEKIEIPVETPPVDNNSVSDDEADFFSNADAPKEKFENVNTEDAGTQEEKPQNPTISQTSQEDEQYFKLAMGLLDSNRAICLSLYVDGNMDNVDKWMYYKDWNDPKHRPILEAGRVVAAKYKLSAFNYLPEFCLILAIVVSSAILFSMAKKEKQAKATAQPNPQTDPQSKENPTKPTKLKKAS